MRRALPLATALLLAFAAYAFQAVQLPGRALACYCMQQTSLAEVDLADQVTIVVGTVGAALPDRTVIGVDTWFHGPFPTNVVWVMGGTNSSSSCDARITAGERRVLILYGGPRAPGANGLYSTSSCAPSGVAGTPEGDALFAEAVAAFGDPLAPPSPDPQLDSPMNLSPLLGEGLVWAGVSSGIGLLLLAAAVFAARRRPAG
jgi:hypothetical protein